MISSLWDTQRPPTFPRFIVPGHKGSQWRPGKGSSQPSPPASKFWTSKRGSGMRGHALLPTLTRIHLPVPFYILLNNTWTHIHSFTHSPPPPNKNISYSLPPVLTKYRLICTQSQFTKYNFLESSLSVCHSEGCVCVLGGIPSFTPKQLRGFHTPGASSWQSPHGLFLMIAPSRTFLSPTLTSPLSFRVESPLPTFTKLRQVGLVM